MQDYKIRIPNPEISRQVQEKAFELGYEWHGLNRGKLIQCTDKSQLWFDKDGRIAFGILESTWNDPDYTNIEISYQDFLRLGKQVGYKIKMNGIESEISWLQDKLLASGYHWGGYSGYNDHRVVNIEVFGFYIYPQTKTFTQSFRESKFNEHYNIEISFHDFMNSDSIENINTTINNTTTEIMSGEVTLKCITAPQRAKNITVDRDYTGILTDSEDTQVDTLREATHFRCVNNNGVEAKYKLALFAPPEPPRPQFPTWEQIESGIYVNADGEVILVFNDEEYVIYDRGMLDIYSDMACCGLNEINGIQSLYASIEISCNLDLLEDNTNQRRLKDLVFKTIVNDAIEENSGAFRIFTLVLGYNTIDTLMQEILTERGGVQTEYRRSSSSGNNIKVFVINL